VKKIIIVGSFVIAITIGGAQWNNQVHGSSVVKSLNVAVPVKDNLLHILKLSSDDDIYTALHNGTTLADLAQNNDVDVQKVINLQVSELTEQLDLRYAEGNLSLQQYEEQKSEVRDLITKSVHGTS
jgi:hypothetical protein